MHDVIGLSQFAVLLTITNETSLHLSAKYPSNIEIL